MSRPVLIMAGGTGGHIFPGLAVARALRERGVPVAWMGAVGGMETRLVPEAGIDLHLLAIGGLRGKPLASLVGAPWRLLRAMRRAWSILGQLRPRAVISFGGYAAGPGGLAATLRRIPLLVHEQNRIAGTTNRILARRACRVLAGFPDVLPGAEWVGNPVRAEIAALPAPDERPGAGRHACWWSVAPGCGGVQPGGAAGAGPAAAGAAPAGAPPVRPGPGGRYRPSLSRRRCRGRGQRVHRRHGRRVGMGRPGPVPGRCPHRRRAGQCRRGLAAGALPVMDDHQTNARFWRDDAACCRRRNGCDTGVTLAGLPLTACWRWRRRRGCARQCATGSRCLLEIAREPAPGSRHPGRRAGIPRVHFVGIGGSA